ncbi:hypothetical protein [Methanolapillus millepedarum]|uniref:Uncharacterized protein n=1 Tax=Methanolapillus millepedarum TaxID=3028296 RepID=A0AA96ZWN7_9EURY|nr:hypothetical protein MsAc7_17700 [Methanosarcinaceae archaeon Ac7]
MSSYPETKKTSVRPNFLSSETGLIQKTYTIPKPDPATPDENGRIIVAGGSLYKDEGGSPIGIVFEDVDVTLGDDMGSVIVQGRVLIDRLDSAVYTTEVQAALNKTGIYFDNQPEVVRPSQVV